MIREAIEADIPQLVDMARKFHDASNQFAPFSEAASTGLAQNLMASPDGVIFITDAGMIGGMLGPAYCAEGWNFAVELFWWAEDRNGLRLLKAFEDWAKSKNANEVRMTTLTNLGAADKILRKRGYQPLEISYGKVI